MAFRPKIKAETKPWIFVSGDNSNSTWERQHFEYWIVWQLALHLFAQFGTIVLFNFFFGGESGFWFGCCCCCCCCCGGGGGEICTFVTLVD